MAELEKPLWPIRLFNKSVLKQRKYKEITEALGETAQLRCLDIGADNGVLSYLLRQRGGHWKSADLDQTTVDAIQSLIHERVFQIDDRGTPFADDEFDRVAVIDFLEHIPDDEAFIRELHRIVKPGGQVILNVPHLKTSLLRKIRLAIGQTDEKHGHLRPGYTRGDIARMLGTQFAVLSEKTYSKFFSECIDTLITFAFDVLKSGKRNSAKGLVITGNDLQRYQKMFTMYSLLYPFIWVVSKLDHLLFFTSGYMLLVVAQNKKDTNA
ncbi:class I SAM-dependent methyltransferase [Candidatus Nitrospira allomarina]|jgi:SAM-dependent methyltransferase|uniref:Class I SAM-dependent methyltransferase n=1 Tax=Candidatus Nitrospira allomarina TaxID=3020900 RepID=A0AA96JYS7_9BACT|nr:class I SAM-dependent methyltransferase [Candidatus Nitrospira allomarina]WNM57944.1 class I SAM-dependent methyltransferase [Candidatus Nitrospira allomarina]